MQEFTKSQRRRLRELTEMAYEREARQSLESIAGKFDEWRANKLDSLALSHALHQYDYGDSRFLWGKYNSKFHDVLVAGAVAKGILTEEELGEELMKLLANRIDFMKRELKEES